MQQKKMKITPSLIMAGKIDEKLSWEDTYKEMAISDEDWSDWEIADETISLLDIREIDLNLNIISR
jgi:hypothetical protein